MARGRTEKVVNTLCFYTLPPKIVISFFYFFVFFGFVCALCFYKVGDLRDESYSWHGTHTLTSRVWMVWMASRHHLTRLTRSGWPLFAMDPKSHNAHSISTPLDLLSRPKTFKITLVPRRITSQIKLRRVAFLFGVYILMYLLQ